MSPPSSRDRKVTTGASPGPTASGGHSGEPGQTGKSPSGAQSQCQSTASGVALGPLFHSPVVQLQGPAAEGGHCPRACVSQSSAQEPSLGACPDRGSLQARAHGGSPGAKTPLCAVLACRPRWHRGTGWGRMARGFAGLCEDSAVVLKHMEKQGRAVGDCLLAPKCPPPLPFLP